MRNLLMGKTQVSHGTATLLFVATALLWSAGGVLIKMVSWNPMAIAGMRSAISAVFILIILRKPNFTWSFPQIAGAVSYSATLILFVSGTKLTTAANAVLLQYTAPIFVAILGAWFLKEKIKLIDYITIALVMCGMVLFFMDNLSLDGMLGNVLAAFSGLSFACLFIFSRMQKDGSPIETMVLGNIITALIGIPFYTSPAPDLTGWVCLAILGVLQVGLAYVLYSIAIRQVTALEAVLTSTVEPLLNPLWVFLVLGEMPSLWAVFGGFIVLVSITARGLITSAKNARGQKEQSVSQ